MVGKTTAANYLVEHYGYQRISLADGVKQLASDMLTEATYLLTGNCKHPTVEHINQNKATFRPFLQWLGTDFVREYLGMPTYWIDSFLLAAQESNKPVVCDDVRFVNEAEALRRAGFTIVRLRRDENERLASIVAAGGNPNDLAHKSETELDNICTDIALYPTGEQLTRFEQLDWLAKELESEHESTPTSPNIIFAGDPRVPYPLGFSNVA